VAGVNFNFKYSELTKAFPAEQVKALEEKGLWLSGTTAKGIPVVANKDNQFVLLDKEPKVLGGLVELFGLDMSKAPAEVAMIRIRGQEIPLGVVLAYYIGLDNLLKHLGVEHRRVLQGDRQNLEAHENAIRFSDETLVYSTKNARTAFLIGGFKFYHKQIRQLSIHSFDTRAPFVDILDAGARSARYTTELGLLNDMFIDPITEEILTKMKEPTAWFPLLLRAAELLEVDYSPDEMDGAEMLFRGYSRFPSAVYKEMVKGLRDYQLKSRLSKTGIDIKPTAVWMAITNDPAVRLYDDTNPIQQLRSDVTCSFDIIDMPRLRDHSRFFIASDVGQNTIADIHALADIERQALISTK
jgi:hypothetical protein